MKNDFSADAKSILDAVGGSENVISVTHCMTRLRFNLADEDLASDSEVENVPSVLRVIRQGGQYQVVIGNDVPKVYSELLRLGVSGDSVTDTVKKESGKKENVFSRFLGFVAGSMTPLLPAMLGGGMVKVLTTLLNAVGVLSETSPTYAVLAIIGDAFFYFLPIMLAASIAERIGSSKMLAMLVAAILLHPQLAALFDAGEVSFIGLPVTSAVYSSSVLPVFIMIPIMKYIEIFADKISPSVIKVFFKPLLVILVAAPLALIVVGPIGAIAGNLLADGVNFLYARAGWLTIALLAAFMPFIIMTGMHYALIPIATISISSLGFDPIVIISMFCSNLAQGGAALGVAAKTRDKSTRQISVGSGVSAIIAGVTEPALYGVTMKFKKPLIAACIAAGVSGLYAGFSGVAAYALGGSPSVFSLIQMISPDGFGNLVSGLIAMTVSLLLSFILTLALYREKSTAAEHAEKDEKTPAASPEAVPVSTAVATDTVSLVSPLSGDVLPLSSVRDETFSEEILGKGCAILPTDGHLYSPVNGTVISVFDTGHAVTLRSEEGAEVLIHIGQDTVALGGRYFTPHKKGGDKVRKGDLLISFDLESIRREGYDLVTPVIVTNHSHYGDLKITGSKVVTAADELMTLEATDKRSNA